MEYIIKIEPNLIIRGTVSKIEERDICEKSENLFEKFIIAKTLLFSDLYGSKICAALDRQHPRDLFDIMLLLDNEGLTENIFKAFLIYLLSSNRPISEILSPNLHDIKSVFEKEFLGMTDYKVKLNDLLYVRKILMETGVVQNIIDFFKG